MPIVTPYPTRKAVCVNKAPSKLGDTHSSLYFVLHTLLTKLFIATKKSVVENYKRGLNELKRDVVYYIKH